MEKHLDMVLSLEDRDRHHNANLPSPHIFIVGDPVN